MQQSEDPAAPVRPGPGKVYDPEEGLGREGPAGHLPRLPDPRVHGGHVLGRRV